MELTQAILIGLAIFILTDPIGNGLLKLGTYIVAIGTDLQKMGKNMRLKK